MKSHHAPALFLVAVAAPCAWAQQPPAKPSELDPFAGVTEAKQQPPADATQSWVKRLFTSNFGFRKEIMSQFDTTGDGNGASRQSVGFEILKKFSTETSTVAAVDFQARLVRRDGYNPVLNDMEGATRQGWAFEYHNLYLDLYNVANPLMGDAARSKNAGRFNFRAGHFYVPFGLNLQTDTHGTLLQLSNPTNFGYERDWYTGFWGSINRSLNYDLYYLTGSGYDLKYQGQTGLGALRLSLGNRFSSDYGLEGGLSLMGGERLASPMADHRGPTDDAISAMNNLGALDRQPVQTERIGIDARYRRLAPRGTVTFTTELSGGRDARNPVFTQLYQAEYLPGSRRWGIASQYRNFQEGTRGRTESIIGEFSWYFRNDVAASNLHWIKLNVERQLHSIVGPPDTIVTLQYYFYR